MGIKSVDPSTCIIRNVNYPPLVKGASIHIDRSTFHGRPFVSLHQRARLKVRIAILHNPYFFSTWRIGAKCELMIHISSHVVGDPGLPMADLPPSECV